MKKAKILIIILLLVFSCSSLADSMLSNAGFEDSPDGTNFAQWSRDMWDAEEGISYLTCSEDAYEGQYCACVENVEENDARFIQTVQVSPLTCYRISCMVRAENCGEDSAGANISIKDTMAISETVHDTNGTWVELVLYGETGEDQTELTVMARVGGYSALNTGKAWFDAFDMQEVAVVPEYCEIEDFSPWVEEASDTQWEDTYAETEEEDYTLSMLLLNGIYLAIVAVLLFFVIRAKNWKFGKKPFLFCLLAAFAFRCVLAVTVRGYGVDMTDFQLWAQRLVKTGPLHFYDSEYFCDYPPGYLWLLWLGGVLNNLVGGAYDSRIFWLLMKLPAILCDMASCVLLASSVKKTTEENAGRLAAALYAFCPAVFLNSAAWGQIDAILAVLLLSAVLLVLRGKWEWALPVYTLSVLMKPQALMFGPVALAALVYGFVTALRDEDRRQKLRRMGLGILGCFLAIAAIAGPFIACLPEDMPSRGIAYLLSMYGKTMTSYRYITVNACNLYTMLNLNWVQMTDTPVWSVVATIFLALSVFYGCFLAWKAQNSHRMFLACSAYMACAFAFAPMMHERYLFPALLLLVIAYFEDRDLRVLASALVMAFTLGMNEILVLVNEHLLAANQPLNAFISFLNVLNALFLAWTGWSVCVRNRVYAYTRVYTPKRKAEKPSQKHSELFRGADYKMRLRRIDALLIAGLTLVYSAVAFTNLGSTKAPETLWTSSVEGEQIIFDLGSVQNIRTTWYGGISSRSFDVQFSLDGENWGEEIDAEYDEGQIFRWLWLDDGDYTNARYIRLTMQKAGVKIYEMAFLDEEGNTLPIASVYRTGSQELRASDAKLLVDEQDTVPAVPSWYNGTYFDEIYHARTGYELLNGMSAYEWTHPPLGKMLIMLGIRIFGMTPFGWRFMGALFGVLMIPLMYLLAQQIFKRTELSFGAALLMALDLMHFTQTRIATIDSFVVFFVMLQTLFMIRYCQMSFYRQKLWRTLIPLLCAGICMGLGLACKWSGAYAGIGIAVLFFMAMGRRGYEVYMAHKHADEMDEDTRKIAQRAQKTWLKNYLWTFLSCIAFFILIPALIYYFSYARQMVPEGGLSIQNVVQLQQDMYYYHTGLTDDTHAFRSPWYEWPLIIKPMWYYSGYSYTPHEIVSSISCMGNPVVWWGGLVAILIVLAKMFTVSRADKRYTYIGIGFLAQYVPWMFVYRSTFIYHYFASVPFIILATMLMADALRDRLPLKKYRAIKIAYYVAALLLFVMFYPIASGTEMPRAYANLLKWFNWLNFV